MTEEHDRVERLAGAIYGTIVVAGVLAATEYDDHPEALETGVYAVATVAVFWLAHAWAQTALAGLFGASDEAAIDIGFWVCVASLAVWGGIVARREQASVAGTVFTALGCGALGLLLVVLKELVS